MMAAVVLGLAGCFVPSVNPLYTEKELVLDPTLIGSWGKTNEAGRWVFTSNGAKAYTWTSQESEGTNVFRAHLLQLGEHRFLDALLVRTTEKWEGIGRASVVMRPAHLFFQVKMTNSTLRLSALNFEWLDTLLKANPQAVAHERIQEPDIDESEGGRVLLTASTAELQRFMLKYAADTNAFSHSDVLQHLEGATR
jgi:hypothetical protein